MSDTGVTSAQPGRKVTLQGNVSLFCQDIATAMLRSQVFVWQTLDLVEQ